MKKIKNISNFPINELKLKFYFYRFIAVIMIFFYSCSNDDASINKSGNATTKKETDKDRTLDKSDIVISDYNVGNVNAFSEAIFHNFESLDSELKKNTNINFTAETMQMLGSATNEDDLKIIFKKAGILNTLEVIQILKNIVSVQQTFIAQNPDFNNLAVDQQVEVLNASVETYINSHAPIIPDGLVGDDCSKTFNKTINRCAGDFGTCAVFAVAGAYAGLAPGLLAAAYCMTSKLSCDSRAKQDFRECKAEQVNPDGPPPVTGEVTVHCDRDSCWTTDSNGKYIETI